MHQNLQTFIPLISGQETHHSARPQTISYLLHTALSQVPSQGSIDAKYAAIDDIMKNYINQTLATAATISVREWDYSGLSQIVVNKSYGWMDAAHTTPTPLNVMMRTASVTKPLTAIAIRRLINDGLLSESTKVFCDGYNTYPPSHANGCVLNPWPGTQSSVQDQRLFNIRISHLLNHKSGIRDHNGALPQHAYIPTPQEMVNIYGYASPPSMQDYLNYLPSLYLQSNPGDGDPAYSNFGYNLLGHVVKVLSPQNSYIEFIQDIAAEHGISPSEIQLGFAPLYMRNPREPSYLTNGGNFVNLFPPFDIVKYPDGGNLFGHMPGAGGVITTPSALLTLMQNYLFIANAEPRNTALWAVIFQGGAGEGTEAFIGQSVAEYTSPRKVDFAVLTNACCEGALVDKLIQELSAIISSCEGAHNNEVQNCGFDTNLSNWSVMSHSGASASHLHTNGTLKVNIYNSGTLPWHVQAVTPIKIPNAGNYRLWFKAKADSPRSITVRIGDDGGDWTDYKTVTVPLTTKMQVYSYLLEGLPADSSARLDFNLGNAGNAGVTIDDVYFGQE